MGVRERERERESGERGDVEGRENDREHNVYREE